MGISVLSIIFSVYFAALAIIISASDDDFVYFLEAEGHYTAILSTFKFSMFMIFTALIYSIILFAKTAYSLGMNSNYIQHHGWMVLYSFIFSYSLFCVFNSTIDALKYSHYRTKYLKEKTKNDNHLI